MAELKSSHFKSTQTFRLIYTSSWTC